MRVIAGKCRHLPLKTPDGPDTRPTTDRIKETLFNILQPDIPGAYFLDLFSGSGGIGIEALSRGAAFCCFAEQNRAALRCIRENLSFTSLEGQAQVIAGDACMAVKRLPSGMVFDIVFMDPPYDRGLEIRVMDSFRDAPCVHEGTLFIIEAALKTDFSWTEDSPWEISRVKTYKTNKHVFLRAASK